MPVTRRQFLALASATCAAGARPSIAQQHAYPSKVVRVVVPYPPGGTTDLIARRVCVSLGTLWDQPLVIENKSGAGTAIGAEAVSRSVPDGYTLLATAEATFVVNPYVYSKLPYSAKDFIPVSGLGVSTHVLVTHPSMPIQTIKSLISQAKANPAGLNYGTFGLGSSSHLNMEMLQSAAGIKLTPVHYKGAAPMLNDLLAGHISLAFSGISLVAEHLKTGRLRALGIGSRDRLVQFPEMPTIAESGMPDFQAISWFGLFAPSGTPHEIVEKINTDVQRVIRNSEFQQQFLEPAYLQPIIGSPEQFAEYVRADDAKWRRIIKEAKISIE